MSKYLTKGIYKVCLGTNNIIALAVNYVVIILSYYIRYHNTFQTCLHLSIYKYKLPSNLADIKKVQISFK